MLQNPSPSVCSNPPCAASLLGDIGFTTATGIDERTGTNFDAGESIYGPFENGFGSGQNNALSGLGCSPASLGYIAGTLGAYIGAIKSQFVRGTQ
jgi:hypothetical protein